ncbi:OLC1v1033592C2 [Oldenlandia corymbosa var. corymbosa]|uniref:OLC1v1033592C2 n=1 Tax=Oldenlandia corymbosa var. corymbosa TaxID=529605 RepID=A0AAV1CPC4_OLDCO|nr:OLC1v1033592C2 [Oldenlandia corymbosa var. corymbosa]
MMDASSPLSTPVPPPPKSSTKTAPPQPPLKKNLVTSLMEVASFRTLSFKEDTYIASNLKPSEKKALQDLKDRLHQSSSDGADSSSSKFSMWGVPLLGGDEKADVILLKFLRARDFRVPESHQMLMKCLAWRKDFGADNILEEDMGFKELEGVVAYMKGYDREGHPVCYNAYGVFKDKGMYERIFGKNNVDEHEKEKLKKFLRWRVQVLERGIQSLEFKPGGVNSIIQVTDLKDMPKRELRVASNHILSLFQDNYPEMVARKVLKIESLWFSFSFFFFCVGNFSEHHFFKFCMLLQIFINVPWYFSMLYSMFSPFLTQRTKSKFVISKEGNVAETLYKFIRPEDLPVQYGGLSRAEDLQGGPPKPASEFTVKGGEKVNIQIDGIEAGATISWDLVVGGWEVEYSAEFVPNGEGSYTIAVEKTRRIPANEEPIRNTFTPRVAGKLVLLVDNTASRRRKVAAYRYIVRKSMAM